MNSLSSICACSSFSLTELGFAAEPNLADRHHGTRCRVLETESGSNPKWFRRLGGANPLWASVLILLVCCVPAGITLLAARAMGYGQTTPAILSAMACCVVASLGAFWIGEVLGKFGFSVAQLLVPMLFRMAFPLGVCVVVIYLRGGRLAKEGFAYYLIAFYLVALAFETLLSVARIRHHNDGAGQSVQ